MGTYCHSSPARMLSATKPILLAKCMTRPIKFIKKKIAVRHRIRGIRHVKIMIKAIQFLGLGRRWRQRMHAHPLLLRVLGREAEVDRLLVRQRMAIGML